MKRWMLLAAFTVVVVGVGHVLVGGDWYAVRKFKQMFPGGELSVAEAQREFEEAKRRVIDARHEAQQAQRRLAEARRNEAQQRRSAAAENAPVRNRFGGIIDPVRTARVGESAEPPLRLMAQKQTDSAE